MPLLFALACTPSEDVLEPTTQDSVPAFEAPWEGLTVSREATGYFDAKLGKDLPGVGWFHVHGAGNPWGTEGTFVRRTSLEGASQDIYSITLMGRDEDLSTWSLQLDVVESAWGSDTGVPVDGDQAVGVLRHHTDLGDDVVAYAVGGNLWLDQGGTGQGDDVEGQFQNLKLAEVTE